MTEDQLSEFLKLVPTEEATQERYKDPVLSKLVGDFVTLTQEVFAVIYLAKEKDLTFLQDFVKTVKVRYLETVQKYNDLTISNQDLTKLYQDAITFVSQEIMIARSMLSRNKGTSLN